MWRSTYDKEVVGLTPGHVAIKCLLFDRGLSADKYVKHLRM